MCGGIMKIAITGSIATDHLMRFHGKFSDSIVAEKLDRISLSFLVDDLEIRRGGVAPNISFGMGVLGLRPILVGAVGPDFSDYRSWLERHNVDTSSVYVSETLHTARFICTTDDEQNQLASFYPGAMSQAREIELGPINDRVGGLDLVLIGPNDPEAMLRHTDECKFRKLAFVADPSQQLAWMEGDAIKDLIDGAYILITNEYEAALIERKTGWSSDEISSRVQIWVTTLGAKGCQITQRDGETIYVVVPPEEVKADPTGVGDAFRAGFLSGIAWGVSLERAAQVGSMLATYVIETVGTQEYDIAQEKFLQRFSKTYGDEATSEVSAHLKSLR
jgi:adenosine kinase